MVEQNRTHKMDMVGQLEQAKSWQARMAALIESHHQLKQQQQQNQQPTKTGKLGTLSK